MTKRTESLMPLNHSSEQFIDVLDIEYCWSIALYLQKALVGINH